MNNVENNYGCRYHVENSCGFGKLTSCRRNGNIGVIGKDIFKGSQREIFLFLLFFAQNIEPSTSVVIVAIMYCVYARDFDPQQLVLAERFSCFVYI